MGPDGISFKFFNKYWKMLQHDIVSFVKDFEVSGLIPRGCNSSFITLVPKVEDPLVISDFRPISLIGSQYKIIAKILANRLSRVISLVVGEVQMAYIKDHQIINGPLMINEIIAWAKKYKKCLMFLKVDFEKAFDSLSWDFLFSILEQMGFSYKWRLWIRSCLKSGFASVLVNGSPTKEFKIERGLRQGDPLSPFLFILAVEALNVALLEASNNNIFKGIKVGKDLVHVSHLQFADDALILGEWSRSNAVNLSRILTCFHLASGLKVNFNKSKLYGIGVSNVELNSLASTIGCLAPQFPCIYLGVPIGAKMSRCSRWSPFVERFHKWLPNWKSKSLSIGGRLTLIKFVLGSLGVYYFSSFKAPKKIISKLESIRRNFFWGGSVDGNKMSWIAWDKVLSPRDRGGLGIGSLTSCNQAMLAKWWWRFRNENHALWRKVICSIYGPSGCLDDNSPIRSNSGVWYHIVRLRHDLLKVNINLSSIFKIKLGNGQTASFWHDTWSGGPTLHVLFPQLHKLDVNPNCYVSERCPISIVSAHAIPVSHHLDVGSTNPNSPPGLLFNWAWRREPRTSPELEELTNLTSLLSHLHLSNIDDA